MDGLEALTQTHLGTWQQVHLDGRVVLAILGLTGLATLFFGLVPVLQMRKPEARWNLLSGSRGVVGKGAHLTRKVLLVGEVTVVTALLFSAGLLIRSYGHLEGLEPGFEAQGVMTVQFSLDDARYAEAENIQRLFRESQARLEEIPGVSSASVALTLPYERPLNLPFQLPGDDEQTQRITNVVYVAPGFFETLDIPLLQGRPLEEGDRSGAPFVAVANQAFVEEYLESQAALGTPVRMGFGGEDGVAIVGVVGNVLQQAGWGIDKTPVWETPTLYLAAAQASGAFMQQVHVWFSPSWIIRGNASQLELAAPVTQAFRETDADLPVARMAALQDIMDEAFAKERFEAAFLLVVAGFALLLAGIGLYGIVAHEVLERRAEMGLRMALGSTPVRAVWTIGTIGFTLTLFGLVLGGGLSVLVSRLLGSLIYGVDTFDPWTMVFLVGIMAIFSAVASFVPAAKIGRTDPAEILRQG
jgi:predicted permease